MSVRGNLLPASETALAFRSSGVLAEVAVKMGDRVEAGQTLLFDKELMIEEANKQGIVVVGVFEREDGSLQME